MATYREALVAWRSLGDRRWEAETLSILGGLEDDVSELGPAAEHHLQALELWRKLSEPLREAATLNRLGVNSSYRGELQSAREALQSALSLWQRHGGCSDEAETSSNLCYAEQTGGDLASALACYQEPLELAKAMQGGFQRAAEQDGTRRAAVRQLALVAWLSRLGRSRQMAVLAMALFVAAVLPVGLALREVGDRDRQLARTRSALEQERERSAAVSRGAMEAERLHSELEASRRELARVQEAQASAVEQLEQSRRPQVNVPILFLSMERSNGSSGEPSRHLSLPAAPGWIVFDLEIDPPYQSTYRVVLRSSAGRDVWRGDLARNERESLTLSVHSSRLEPGDYTLTAEGLAAGKPLTAGRFAFRVLPSGGKEAL